MFARVMGGHEMGSDLGIPIIVVHANDDDGGNLQRRMARHPAYAREQVALALATVRQPEFRTGTCCMIAAKLITNILAGSDFDPSVLDPGAIADAFYAISADCLAAFVATRLATPAGQAYFCQLPDAGADSLETGVLVLLTHLARDRRLRPVQFARLVRHAATHGVHHVESNEYPNKPPIVVGAARLVQRHGHAHLGGDRYSFVERGADSGGGSGHEQLSA